MAASLLAQKEGDYDAAMDRAFDAMEFAGKASRGRGINTLLETVAVHGSTFRLAQRPIPSLPAAAIPGALERVRRIRRSWPSWTEILEAERIYTQADQTWLFQQPYRHPTPLHTLRAVGELTQLCVHSTPDERESYLLCWLEPKRYALRNMDDYIRQVIAESRKPIGQQRAVRMPGDYLSQLCLSRLVGSRPSLLSRVHDDLAMLEVALAVRMHRLERGRYPTRLADISLRWLPAVPLQLEGRSTGYELRKGQPVISCRGPDGQVCRVFGALRPVPAGFDPQRHRP